MVKYGKAAVYKALPFIALIFPVLCGYISPLLEVLTFFLGDLILKIHSIQTKGTSQAIFDEWWSVFVVQEVHILLHCNCKENSRVCIMGCLKVNFYFCCSVLWSKACPMALLLSSALKLLCTGCPHMSFIQICWPHFHASWLLCFVKVQVPP